jgi:hypothetical protein
MNVLAKSRSQPPTPELRTSTFPGRSRRKKALTLFSRIQIPQNKRNSMSPFFLLGQFLGFCDLLPPSEALPINMKHFSSKLKCWALYQALTQNLTQKAEMPEMLKCHFSPVALSNPLASSFERARLPSGTSSLLPSPLKRSLKRLGAIPGRAPRFFCKARIKHSPTRPAFPFFPRSPVLFPFVTQSMF